MYYYYTDGEAGSLVASGFSSESIFEGVDASGWYVREGTPPANYTEKSSEFDIWNTETRKWDVNPNQAALEAALEEEMRNRDKQKLVMTVLTERKAKLVASDWTQLPDVPLETKQVWATYRQALRDITDQPGYPTDVVWPTPP